VLTSSFSNLDKGAYVLVVGPVSGFQEKAPMRTVAPNGAASGCGSKYAVEGVEFDLLKLDIDGMTSFSAATRTQIKAMFALNDASAISKLRSILAHVFFESEAANAQRPDPFKRLTGDPAYINYGGLAEMRRLGQLTACRVPLALIYWSGSGVQFIDNWAVRRLARRVLDLDLLSILRSYGYERLLQFQNQLQELFDRPSTLGALRLQDYFQYLPPVGYFPITGVRSPRGFHPTNFFRQFTIGAASRITVERLSGLLRESFAGPDIDLQARPLFELFDLNDNTRAVDSGASAQLCRVFVTRSLSGPLSSDGVASSLRDAWEVYRGFIKRRAFLTSGNDQDTIASHSLITNALRDVLDMSNRHYALAAGRALETVDALKSFQEMHRVQSELATLFLTGLTVPDPTLNRNNFALGLNTLLNNTSATGVPGLLPAVTANDLPAAVVAQNAINNLVANWSGVGVAIGPIVVSKGSAPEGEDLVLGGAAALPFNYTVLNGTDRRLTIALETSITALHGDWTGSARIFNAAGVEIDHVDLNAGASATIVVKANAGTGAVKDETATLIFKASVPAPTSKQHQVSRELRVSDQQGDPVLSSVVILGVGAPAGDMTNAAPATTFGYAYVLRYNPAPGVTSSANFRFTLQLTATGGNPSEWQVSFHDTTTPGGNHALGEYTQTLELFPAPESRPVLVSIITPARGGTNKSVSFTARIESISLAPAITPVTSEVKNITVRPRP
jgi:hypothetical protein